MNTNKVSSIGYERTFQSAVSRPFPSLAMRPFDDLPVSVLSFEGSALIDANHEWVAISGLDVIHSAGDGWLTVIHPDDRMNLSASVEHKASESRGPVSVRVCADGRPDEWFRAHVHTVRTSGVAQALLTLTAVGPDNSYEGRLVHMATHDGLNGLGAIRADVDQSEKRTLAAWQVSTANRDFERSARLVSVRAALRRASLLLSTSPEVDTATTIDALAPDPRPDQLQAAHDSGVAVAQATGMIAQRSGANATESAALLHEYATTNQIAFVIAAKMIVERAIDIDTVVAPFEGSDDRLQPSGTMPDRGLEQIAAKNWLAQLRNVYGEHSAAVFGCAAFICGDAAAKVTERVFVTFWEQPGFGESSAAAVRIQLLTITHRLAMNAALSVTRKHDERSPLGAESPSVVVAAVLSRGQAIERTLACASLTPTERSLAALVIYGRCTYHEVARILDVPEDDVSQLLRTGLLHVRTELSATR